MKINRFVKRLFCVAIAVIMMFGTSFSVSAARLEPEDITSTDNDTEIENIGAIDSDIEIGDVEPIEEFVYLEGDILEGQVAEFSGYGDTSVLSTGNTPETEEEMTINLLGLGYESNSSFKSLFTNNELLLSGDPTDYYFGMQGGCTDGEYNYFAFIVKDASQTHLDTRIVCYKIDEPESSRTLYWTTGLKSKLQHINDMTYNSITGEIVIACCQGGYYQQLYTIDANEFRFIPSDEQQNQAKISQDSANLNLVRHNVSCMVTSIGFNETRNQYVVGLSKQTNYIAVLDSDFNLIKKVGYEPQENDDNWAGQGLHCDNKYIYLTQFLNIEKPDKTKRKKNEIYESRIKIFDWNGNHKRTIRFEVNKQATGESASKNERYCEVENMFVVDNRVYLGFNCLYNTANREFTYIDITNYTYYIQYCPDENVENYYEQIGENCIAKVNNNVKGIMWNGLETNLYRSRITKSGKKFIGWTAYRPKDGTWLYSAADAVDDDNAVWYTDSDEEKPNGYEKYVYYDTEQVNFSNLGGELILLCAQWEDNNNEFTVKFFSSGGTGTMANMKVVHGVAQVLKKNEFTKAGREFQGWNAYWPEKNKWYYCSKANRNNRGWYTEGCEPTGYIKYKYAYDQSVAQTVYAGSNVYMYAVWNEFTVYYNANGVEVEAAGIIDSQIAEYEGTNNLYSYNTDNLYKVTENGKIIHEPYKGYELKCYYQYWVEEDKWRCIDENGNGKWYSMDTIKTNGYSMYERDPSSHISTTVHEGERLVLYAVWSKN